MNRAHVHASSVARHLELDQSVNFAIAALEHGDEGSRGGAT